jgi:hypothetical protein
MDKLGSNPSDKIAGMEASEKKGRNPGAELNGSSEVETARDKGVTEDRVTSEKEFKGARIGEVDTRLGLAEQED